MGVEIHFCFCWPSNCSAEGAREGGSCKNHYSNVSGGIRPYFGGGRLLAECERSDLGQEDHDDNQFRLENAGCNSTHSHPRAHRSHGLSPETLQDGVSWTGLLHQRNGVIPRKRYRMLWRGWFATPLKSEASLSCRHLPLAVRNT